jgi:flotillin
MISLMIWGIIAVVAVLFILFLIFAGLYTIVPADYVDVVIQRGKINIFSSHKEYSTNGKAAYFNIPGWFFIFGLGMEVHRIPLKIITINVPNFLAFDKDRARFICDIICYVTVKDPLVAAKRFSGDVEAMKNQVSMIVQATTRDVTTKKPIREIINNRDDIINTISPKLAETITHWGLSLNDIELIDFKDPDMVKDKISSHVIEDISTMIETQITSEMRQKNAGQNKEARLKEAEAEQDARKRELEKEEAIKKREQEVLMNVSIQQKLAKEKELEVTRTVTVTNAEIEKAKQIILANQQKEVEAINKEQKKLIGEGDRAQKEEQAKGDAAKSREEGLAQAAAKEALQLALNKFGDTAIRALVAEKLVEAYQAVGIKSAEALARADVKIMSGG